MKKLFTICCLLITCGSFAQVKIDNNGSIVPVGNNNATEVQYIKGAAQIVASLTARDAIPAYARIVGMTAYNLADSSTYRLVGGIANGNWTKEVISGGTVTNYFSNGSATFTLDTVVNTNGSKSTIKIFTGGRIAEHIRTGDLNGSGFSQNSETIGDTTYIYYPIAPDQAVHYIITGTIKPVGETGLNATPQSLTSILLGWNDIEHETGYEIDRSYDSANWQVMALLAANTTSYLDTGLLANSKYFYRARGTTDTSQFLYGNFSYASATTATLARLSTPSPTTVTAVSFDSVLVTRTNVANAINYLLQFGADKSTWTDIGVFPSGTTSYYHTPVSASTKLYYQWYALADNVNYINSLPALDSVTTPSAPAKQLPAVQFTADAVSYDEIDLHVTPVPNATAYIFYVFDPTDSTWKTIDTLGANETVVIHAPLSDTTLFNYRGVAVGDGVNFLTSDYSYAYASTFAKSTPDTLILSTPAIHATTTSASVIHVTFNTTAHAKNIVVEHSTNNQTWTVVGTFNPAIGSINDINLQANTKYYERAYFEADNATSDSVYINSAYALDSAITSALTPLTTPTTTASNINSSSNLISWTNVTNESGYTVQSSLNKAAWTTIKTTAVNIVTFTHTALQPNTKYYYRVRANANNGTNANSAYSNIDSAVTSSGTTTLATPVVTATGIDQTSNLVQWGNVPNADNYTIDRSINGTTWLNIGTVAAGTLSVTDTALQANTVYNYRVQANSTNPAYLQSGYGSDTAKTLPVKYITNFGIISEPQNSGLQQPDISARTADSLGICLVRSQATIVQPTGRVDRVLQLGKELHANIHHYPLGDTSRGFTKAGAERVEYVHALDTLIRQHFLGKKIRYIAVNNEEDWIWRKQDTVVGSSTNSAYCYYYNELKPLDSLAKLIGAGQFVVSNGGITQKPAVWFTWKNLIDSGRTAEAAAFAREVFLPSEIPSLASWATGGPNPVGFRIVQQLIPLYRAASFDYLNLHIKMPLNGIDSAHVNPMVIRLILQCWKNLVGKPVITDEIAANSLNPTYTPDLLQNLADNQVAYGIVYDGPAYVTIPTSAGLDPSLRKQSDGKTLNAIGNAAKVKLSTELNAKACPITLSITPTVDAGGMKSIVYSGSGSKVTLSGSATNAVTTVWTQVSGVSTATITAPNSLASSFSNLQQGVYSFALAATSATGTTVKDTTYVSVLQKVTYTAGGLTRTALVHYPPGASSAPMIIAFHGHSQQAISFAAKMFEVYAQNWIVVYPQGLPTPSGSDPDGQYEGWQRTVGYTNPNFPGVVDPDIKFYDAIRRDLIDNHNADSTKEFIHGWSNGCQLIYDVLWVARGSQLAGISGAAGILGTTSGKVVIPAFHIAGLDDDKVPFTSQQKNIPKFQQLNTCSTTGTIYATAPGQVIATKYASTTTGHDFVFLQYKGPHPYPDNTVPPIVIQFFKQETGL